MARQYGKAWFSMFTDDHFTAQPNVDKFLYMTLLGQPSLNYAGVTPINLKRWRKAIREGNRIPTEAEIKASLIRLERNGYVFTDDDTGEVLVRSFMRRDEINKQPNVILSALRAVAQVESPKLGHVLQREIARIEMPVVNGESGKATKLRVDLDEAQKDATTHLDALAKGSEEPFPEPFVEDFPEGLSEALSEPFPEPFGQPFSRPGEIEPFRQPFGEGLSKPPVVVEVEVAPLRTADKNLGETRVREESAGRDWNVKCTSCGGRIWTGGADGRPHLSGLCHQCRAAKEPPTPYCDQHPDGTDAPCHACGAARKARADWESELDRAAKAAVSTDNRQRAALRAQAIAECDLCDEDGYDGRRPCDHTRRESFAVNGGRDDA